MPAWDWWNMMSTCEFHLKSLTLKLVVYFLLNLILCWTFYQVWRQIAITFLYSYSSQWTCCVLGHQEPPAKISDHCPVGEQLCFSLQQRQPQPALQHVWLWVPHLAEMPHQLWGVYSQGWSVEPAERGEGLMPKISNGYINDFPINSLRQPMFMYLSLSHSCS